MNGRAVRDRAVARAVTEAYRATGVRDPRPEVAALPGRAAPHGGRQRPSGQDGGALRGAAHGLVRGRARGARRRWPRARGARPRACRCPASSGRGPRPRPRRLTARSRRSGPAARRVVAETLARDGAGRRVRHAARGRPAHRPRPAPQHLHRGHRRRGPAPRGPAHRPRARALRGDRGRAGRARPRSRRSCSCRWWSPSRRGCGRCWRPHQETLRALGFDAEPFGGDAVRVRRRARRAGRPRPGRGAGGAAARSCSSASPRSGRSRPRATGMAATLACHSAVRAGQALAPGRHARDRAPACGRRGSRRSCPHGRPTRVRLPREDVSRWFRRTGWGRD